MSNPSAFTRQQGPKGYGRGPYPPNQNGYMAFQAQKANPLSASRYGWQKRKATEPPAVANVIGMNQLGGGAFNRYGYRSFARPIPQTTPPPGKNWGQQPPRLVQQQAHQQWHGYRQSQMRYPVAQSTNLPQHAMQKTWDDRQNLLSRGGRHNPEVAHVHDFIDHDMYGESRLKGFDRDRGRGSYRCGRCGAPKKGHVCPYQSIVKRRSDEATPQLKNASVQAEMDEFMTLRRLNIEIQGFPESYPNDSMPENMVAVASYSGTAISSSPRVGVSPHPSQISPPNDIVENRETLSAPRASPIGATGEQVTQS